MTKEAVPVETKQPMNRDDIRAKIFANTGKPKSKVITFFDTEVELRQPSVGEIEELQDTVEVNKARTVRTLIRYAYVPGTDEKMFDNADIEGLSQLPWSKGFSTVVKTVAELTGVDIGGAEKN